MAGRTGFFVQSTSAKTVPPNHSTTRSMFAQLSATQRFYDRSPWGVVMDRKPFEITAACEIAAFSTSADIERFSTQLERRRQSRPNIVRATVNPPATYTEQRYVLQTRFVVWAKDAAMAVQAVEGLIHDAGVRSRTVLPSGRALAATEVPPPPPPEVPRRAATSPRPPASGRGPQRRARKGRASSKVRPRTQRSDKRPKR